MHQFRVTKYDPAFRDAAGAYTQHDWTSFSDIGRLFGGVTLSDVEYLRVESAYIETAMKFFREDNAPALRVVGIENSIRSGNAPTEGLLLSVEDLANVCRSVLRDEFWCRFEAGGRFLHFGYDYYMYVGVKNDCASAIRAAQEMGLFVERFASPYSQADQEA